MRLAQINGSEVSKIFELILISLLLAPGSHPLSFLISDHFLFPSEHSPLQLCFLFTLPSVFPLQTEIAESDRVTN